MKIIPQAPLVYRDKFPSNYINDVRGWAFSKETLKSNIGRLLTLDIDFDNYCDLNCPYCFRRNNRVQFESKRLMKYEDIVDVIKQAKELGLRSVKFLGAGEPLESKDLLKFLEELNDLDIIPLIFTKGHVMGDDGLVKKFHGHYGLNTGKDLVKRLKELNVSILLGFNAFTTEIQDKMVGRIEGYTLKRNRALELLVEAGFNEENPTRLCLATNPVINNNFDEILEIYKWARVRNMYVIVCPPMVSGRCSSKKYWQEITPPSDELVWLYTEIYKFNIEKGIQTFKQIKEEGIASYAGGHPCNQIACGMYVTLPGIVLRCPGNDTTKFGNIWEKPLKDIWVRSENYGRSGSFNCECPPKFGKTIPYNLFTDVLLNLEKWSKEHGYN